MTATLNTIQSALKKLLKDRDLHYADVAKGMGVSQRTVKRILNDEDCAINRVVELCDFLKIEFFDLVEFARHEEEETFQLTDEQEEFFSAANDHFNFFNALRDGLAPKAIQKKNYLSAASVEQYLKDLEGLKLLERLPGQKVKLLVKGGLNLKSSSALSKTLYRKSRAEMFAELDKIGSSDTSLGTGTEANLRAETIKALINELKSLAKKYRELAQREGRVYQLKDLVRMKWIFAVHSPFEPTHSQTIRDIAYETK